MQKYILLLSRENYLIVEKGKKINTKFGVIDTRNVEIGDVIETKKEKFVAIEPTVMDLMKKCRRGAQVILPKDACQITAITGIRHGWRCLDAGAGSGFLAIFLGNIVGRKGRVVTNEKRKEFYEIARRNIEICGMERIVKIKNEDVRKFRERNLDLITFDLKNAHKLVEKAKKGLRKGGWLVIYSPHVEEQIKAIEEMKKHGFYVYATIETIQRKWKSLYGYTHPEPSGILHTGFMTFGRKVLS